MSAVKRIIVPATFQKDGAWNHKPAVFELGLGSCGLVVTALAWEVGDGCLYVLQTHNDGTFKHFVYPLGQLTGRVEVER
jgi:hypothetical protein